MILRNLYNIIRDRLFQGKAIIILGPRQSGKTTLLRFIERKSDKKSLFLNCDEAIVRKHLNNQSFPYLKNIISDNKLILIDEAQRVKNIGLTLKIIIDHFPGIQVVASGSSAFELTSNINEPLTGRKFEYYLLPISSKELIEHTNIIEEESQLVNRLVYGMYPDVINNPGKEIDILENLTNSYLYKDIFSFYDLRKPEILEKLLEALAFQVASEVSYNELSRLVGIDFVTIQRYIDLLEKAFVIFRLRSFSRNLRNELKKSRKIYFYDNG
ncbi:MAG: ATP-binding protein, partial [Calditrichia bacterium]|nr:ATP-binding protein [Calditrichia bacterium]